MGWLLKGLGFVGSLFGIGGGSTTASPTQAGGVVGQVEGIVQDYKPGAQDLHNMQVQDDQLAQQATAGAQALQFQTHNTWFDVFVDGYWRLMRPLIITALLLGYYGFFPLPKPGSVDPLFLAWVDKVMYFLFGGRLILKDIPSALSYILAMRGKGS